MVKAAKKAAASASGTTIPVADASKNISKQPAASPAAAAATATTAVATATTAAAEDADDKKMAGFIFICNSQTKQDCYINKVFGLPRNRLPDVEKITPGTKLFLYDIDQRLLYGMYQAVSKGGPDLVPGAFGGRYPAQVKFKIDGDYLPVKETTFRKAIIENYNGKKFSSTLSAEQVPIYICFCASVQYLIEHIRVQSLKALFEPIKSDSEHAPPRIAALRPPVANSVLHAQIGNLRPAPFAQIHQIPGPSHLMPHAQTHQPPLLRYPPPPDRVQYMYRPTFSAYEPRLAYHHHPVHVPPPIMRAVDPYHAVHLSHPYGADPAAQAHYNQNQAVSDGAESIRQLVRDYGSAAHHGLRAMPPPGGGYMAVGRPSDTQTMPVSSLYSFNDAGPSNHHWRT